MNNFKHWTVKELKQFCKTYEIEPQGNKTLRRSWLQAIELFFETENYYHNDEIMR